MAKYIEADVAIQSLRTKAVARYPASFCNGIMAAAVELEKMPATEVSEKPCGRWMLKGRKILCSHCKAVFEEVEEQDLFSIRADLPYLCQIEKFCFNCGADMRQPERS